MGSFWSSEGVLALGLVLAAAAFAYSPIRPPFCASKPRRLAAPAAHGASGGAGTVSALWRYPIKGFPADALDSVALAPNGTFPSDRVYALLDVAYSDGAFDEGEPKWVHKQHFHGAFRSRPALATLNTTFRDGVLEFRGEERLSARLDAASGRAAVEAAAAKRLGRDVRLVTGGETHQFGNTRSGVKSHGDTRTIHLVNAASVAAVRAATGLDVDPAVFRPNIVLDGLEAWAEEAWVGEVLRVGGATLEVISRTVRCDAINFHPRTGERWPGNRDLVTEIADNFPAVGPYLGLYARVLDGGTVSLGDAARPLVS